MIARIAFMVTPATRMNSRATRGFDSNQRCSGMGFGPNGFIALGSQSRSPSLPATVGGTAFPPTSGTSAALRFLLRGTRSPGLPAKPCGHSRQAAARARTYSVSPHDGARARARTRWRIAARRRPRPSRPGSVRAVHEDHEPEHEKRCQLGSA